MAASGWGEGSWGDFGWGGIGGAATGVAATGAAGSVATVVTVALSGVSASGAVGTVASLRTVAVTGVVSSGAVAPSPRTSPAFPLLALLGQSQKPTTPQKTVIRHQVQSVLLLLLGRWRCQGSPLLAQQAL